MPLAAAPPSCRITTSSTHRPPLLPLSHTLHTAAASAAHSPRAANSPHQNQPLHPVATKQACTPPNSLYKPATCCPSSLLQALSPAPRSCNQQTRRPSTRLIGSLLGGEEESKPISPDPNPLRIQQLSSRLVPEDRARALNPSVRSTHCLLQNSSSGSL